MAKAEGPLYSINVSGAFGEIVFDRRGFIRRKGRYTNPKTAKQGNARQALAAAQQGIKLCGPQTRQHLRAVAKSAARWSPYLTQQFLGPKRAHFLERQARYRSDKVDQAAWEQAGLEEIRLDYAEDGPISAGAQLFMLATTLYKLDIYKALGDPAGDGTTEPNVEGWKDSIIS